MESHNIEQGVYLNRPAMTDLERLQREEAREKRATKLLCAVITGKIALMCCLLVIFPLATGLIVWYALQ